MRDAFRFARSQTLKWNEIMKPTEHAINPANDRLVITVVDDPGHGGANHRYDITGFDTKGNPAERFTGWKSSFSRLVIIFQNGPIGDGGNGERITHESLLAIVAGSSAESFPKVRIRARRTHAPFHIEEAHCKFAAAHARAMRRGVEGEMKYPVRDAGVPAVGREAQARRRAASVGRCACCMRGSMATCPSLTTCFAAPVRLAPWR